MVGRAPWRPVCAVAQGRSCGAVSSCGARKNFSDVTSWRIMPSGHSRSKRTSAVSSSSSSPTPTTFSPIRASGRAAVARTPCCTRSAASTLLSPCRPRQRSVQEQGRSSPRAQAADLVGDPCPLGCFLGRPAAEHLRVDAEQHPVAEVKGQVAPQPFDGPARRVPVGHALRSARGEMGVCNEGDAHRSGPADRQSIESAA